MFDRYDKLEKRLSELEKMTADMSVTTAQIMLALMRIACKDKPEFNDELVALENKLERIVADAQ